MDNTVCTYGSMVEYRKGTAPKLIDLSINLKYILINTKIPRNTKILVEKVATIRGRHETIIDDILELMNNVTIEAVEMFKKINSGMGDEFDVLQYYDNLGVKRETVKNKFKTKTSRNCQRSTTICCVVWAFLTQNWTKLARSYTNTVSEVN